MRSARRAVARLVSWLGYEVVRRGKSQLLGLDRLPICTVVDIGANRGQFAKFILDVFPQARVYCFEPLPTAFEDLRNWTRSSRPESVLVFNVALGEHVDRIEMLRTTSHDESSSVLRPTALRSTLFPQTREHVQVSVEQTTLDRAVGDFSLRLDPEVLVKIDVEGYEDRVIRGGTQTIGQARACVLEVCLDPIYEGQATFPQILMLMDSLEFGYAGNLRQVYASDGHVICLDAVFVR